MPKAEEVQLTLNLPTEARRWLISMAVEDVREKENFILWLIWREAQRRGLIWSHEQIDDKQALAD